MPLFPQGLFLPAALPKTSDPSRKCQAIPTATPAACASKFQPEPRLHGQSASLPGLWLQHWKDVGVLGTKPGLEPHHPSLLSSGSGSSDVTVRPECCHYSKMDTGPSTSTLKGPSHPKIGSRILTGGKLAYNSLKGQ